MSFIIIQVTYPTLEEANRTIKHLLQKRLISSANSFPIKSTSSWTGKIKEVNEVSVFLKTKKGNWEKVKSEVKKMHSYKIPCIARLNVEANEEYEGWVKQQTE